LRRRRPGARRWESDALACAVDRERGAHVDGRAPAIALALRERASTEGGEVFGARGCRRTRLAGSRKEPVVEAGGSVLRPVDTHLFAATYAPKNAKSTRGKRCNRGPRSTNSVRPAATQALAGIAANAAAGRQARSRR